MGSKSNVFLDSVVKEILESMYDGVYLTDNKGYTLFVNEAYTKISGIKKEELIGYHMDELIESGYFRESASLMVLKKKKAVTIIDCFKNGKKCLVTSSPVFDENGNIVMVVTNLRDMTELVNVKKQLEDTENLNRQYYLELKELRKNQLNRDNIIGSSKKMDEIFEFISKIADVDATVLILGETGVGKEVLAKEIHKTSNRKDGPFIKVNCASIPESLFESELFGYEKGAFTGAGSKGKPGMFELANNGTLLLDEIGELSLNVQSKLLRVLQEKQITRVGGTKVHKVNTRIIAATNQDLKAQVEEGNFREDLFYRLNVLPITIPPLRERKEDIPLLAVHFLETFNSKYNKNKILNNSAFELLKIHSWPGNVRELKNMIERLVLICPSNVITDDYIVSMINEEETTLLYDICSGKLSLNEAVSTVEKQLIYKALKNYGTTRKAAKALGVSQPTIVRKANKYSIETGS